MRIRRRFITYADIYGITHHKLAGNYLTMLVTVVDKNNYKHASVAVTFVASNANRDTAALWVEGKHEGYTELECECNH